jgi:predicted RNA-binding Zn-ribbon protein involved in translation (DUF1610 family)
MPSHFATRKRNAPTDFKESERPVKMLRSDLTPTSVRAFATMAPTPSPPATPSPVKGALKRKCEALNASEDLAASKRLRLGASFGVAGTTTTLPTGCRGGKRRRNGAKKVAKRATVAKTDEATTRNTSPPPAVEDTAGVSASTEEEAAVTTSEDAVKAEGDSGEDSNEVTTGNISTPSAGEDTVEVSEAKEEDAVATAIECAEDYLNACASKHTAEVPTATECVVKAEDNTDAPVDQDTAEVSTFTEGDAAATTSESGVKAEDDSNNSSEPVSSSRKSVGGSIESLDSSSSEPASSSQKSTNGSSETLETILSASESEEAPKKTSKMAVKQNRYITGLVNNGNQCFANATLQFFDAAMDGYDLDLLLGKDVNIDPFSIPALTPEEKELERDTNAPKRGRKPVTKVGKFKALMRNAIKTLRSMGELNKISPRKHLRALLSHMRGSKATGQPELLSPMVFHQVLAFGGADESVALNHLDGTTQEDCFEYFGALMSEATSTAIEEAGAAPENSAEGAATLKSLFEVKRETTTRCTSCDQNIDVKIETSNAISVPAWKSPRILELMELLEASKTSIWTERKCPKCGEKGLADVAELKDLGDNLVVHINRVDPSDSGVKFETRVELPLDPITICGKEFILNAVVKHRGPTVDFGHYTVLRRRSPEWMTDEKSLWYLIDDHDIEGIKTRDVRDGAGRSHSAMLLFKAT